MLDDKVRFAMAMRLGRAALGMGQQEFADLLGVSKSTIARNETLEMAMRVETLSSMIRELRERGVELDILGQESGLTLKVDDKAIQHLKTLLDDESQRRIDRKKRLN
jgi:transcriptional regulator with XRE-family HTH domain